MQLDVSHLEPGQVPLASISGEVDVYSAPVLRDGLSDLLDSGSSVIVDLTEVGFLDSTGLGALVAARKIAEDKGAELPLVCTKERILKLFTITGLDGVFAIHTTVADAQRSLAGADPV